MTGVWGPPGNLRLVVLDTETTLDPDRRRRAVAVGLVVCSGRTGALSRQVSWLINPGCAIDPKSREKHHIADEDVAEAPPFAQVWPDIAAYLKPRKGETLLLVAHNAPFDLSLLRSEIARTGVAPALPDVPFLDTMRGLLDASGIITDRRDLETVAAAVGVRFSSDDHHDALSDATATARIARILIDRALANGHDDIAALLGASGGRAASVPRQAEPADAESEEPLPVAIVPDAHLTAHARPFPERPTGTDLARWRALFAECGALRCSEVAAPDGIPDGVKRRILFGALEDAIRSGDATSVATVLGALAPLFATLPEAIAGVRVETGAPLERVPGWTNRRGVAGVVWQHLERMLAGVPRCPAGRPCPACRLGEPCPRDAWVGALAEFALPEPDEASVVAFWNPRGQATDERGKGAGRGWAAMRTVAPPLADATLRRCLDFYRAHQMPEHATDVADQVWREGCRDPGVTAIHSTTTAAGGRPADLELALLECREVLARRLGNTERAWDHLAVVAAMIDGRLARSRVPPSARHVARRPSRPSRPPRFLRAGV